MGDRLRVVFPESPRLPRNRLILGDCLKVMRSMPSGCLGLIYLDPPFMTEMEWGDEGASFKDSWKGRGGRDAYLGWLGARLEEARRLLDQKGSLCLHLDHRTTHRARCLLDDIFGGERFVNEIIWRRRTSPMRMSRAFARSHETILVYAKGGGYVFNADAARSRRSPEQGRAFARRWSRDDGDGPHALMNLAAPTFKKAGAFEFRGVKPPRKGWILSPASMERLFKAGEIVRDGATWKRKRWLSDPPAPPMMDSIWTDIPPLNGAQVKGAYPTQKPEALLERLVSVLSRPGACVGDFFGGGGTTAAVSERLGRRWVYCDRSPEACKMAEKRLAKVASSGGDPERGFVVEAHG